MRKLVVGDLGAEPSADCNLALYVVLEIIEGYNVFHAAHVVLTTSLHITAHSSPARVAKTWVRGCSGQHALRLVLVLLFARAKVVE